MLKDSEADFSSVLMKNTLWNIFSKIFVFFLGLFLTYYTVNKIGIERYGIYALITATGGYLSLMDINASSSFVKYISEFKGLGHNRRINYLLSSGLLFYIAVSFVIIFLVLYGGNYAVSWLKIPCYLSNEAYKILIVYGFIVSFSGLFSPYNAVISGLERFDISGKVNIFLSVLNFIGSILFLEKGYGLMGLAINNLIIVLMGGFFSLYFSYSLLPDLSVNPFLADKEMLKKIFFFGSKLQITRLSSVVSSHFEKIVITRMTGVSWVAFYQIGNSLCEQARNIPILITSALFPAFSRLDASGRKKDIKEIYLRGIRYVAFIAVPIMIFLSVSSKQIMLLWMGEGYSYAAQIVSILSIGYLINTVFGAVGAATVQGIGKPEIQMKGALFNMSLNAILSVIFIFLFGFPGAAYGTSLAMTAAVIYFIYVFHPIIEVKNRFFLKLISKIFFAGIAALIGVIAFYYFSGECDSKKDVFSAILFSGFIYSFVYFSILIILKPFDYYDGEFFGKSKFFLIRLFKSFCSDEKHI
ncbi:MAG: flippase [Elusimicrobiota bacterium]